MPTINLNHHEAKAAAEKRLRLIVRPAKDVPGGVDKIYVGLFAPMGISRDGTQYAKEEVYGAWSEDGEWSCKSPFGQPGDVLACRETWQVTNRDEYVQYPGGVAETVWPSTEGRPHKQSQWNSVHNVIYKASGGEHISSSGVKEFWRPSTRMPQWAIRHHLPIRSIAVKRVAEITEAEAIAAGFSHTGFNNLAADEIESAKEQFLDYWQSKHPNASWAWFVTVGE